MHLVETVSHFNGHGRALLLLEKYYPKKNKHTGVPKCKQEILSITLPSSFFLSESAVKSDIKQAGLSTLKERVVSSLCRVESALSEITQDNEGNLGWFVPHPTMRVQRHLEHTHS